MRQDAWRAYLEMALGVTEASGKKALKTAKKLVGRSGVSAEQLQGMADELVRASAANREAVRNLVRVELERALGAFGLAKADEVETLTARVRELEATLQATKPEATGSGADNGPVPSSLTTPTAKKTVAKKAVAKKAVAASAVPEPAAEKAAAGPAAAAPAETGVAETVGAEPPAKAVAKKTTAKKTVAKKAPPAQPGAQTMAAPAKKAAKKAASRAEPSAIGAEITAPAPGPAGPEPGGAAPAGKAARKAATKAVKKTAKQTTGSADPAQ